MTLLLREVVRFVAEAGLWLLALAAVTGTTAAAVLYGIERRVAPRDLGIALVAGALTAAVSHRLGIAVWAPEIAGRPLPVLWAAVGAAGLTLAITTSRRKADT